MDRILQFLARSYRHPGIVILAALALVVFLALGLSRLRFDADVRSMMPEGNPDVAVNDYYDSEAVFGDSNLIFIGVESADAYAPAALGYLRRLQTQIEALNQSLPPANLASALGISPEDGIQLRTALGNLGWNLGSAGDRLQSYLPADENRARKLGVPLPVLAAVQAWLTKNTAADLYRLWQNPVDSVSSLVNADDIVNEDDTLKVRKLVDSPDLTPAVSAELRARVARWSLYTDTLVSADGRLSTVLIKLTSSHKTVQSSVDAAVARILAQNSEPGIRTYLDGESVIGDLIGVYIFQDISLLLPLVILAVLTVLFFCFRRWQGVVYPTVVLVVAVVTAVGFMAWVNVPLNVVSVAMPVLLVAIASAYAIHQLNHYFLDPDPDRRTVLSRNIRTVGLAVTLSGITVMVGFGALAVESFQPIRHFGLFTAAGDLLAVGAALVVLPALLLMGKPSKKARKTELRPSQDSDQGLVGALLHFLARVSARHPVPLLAVTLGLTLVLGLGVFQVKSELNNVSFFRPDSPIRQADDKLNDQLAGTQVLNIILDTDLTPVSGRGKTGAGGPQDNAIPDLTNPAVLNRIEAFTQAVQKKFPFVRKSLSFNDLIKKMNQEMRGGSPADFVVPQDPALVSQYLLVYSGDLSGLLTPDHGKLRITLTLRRAPTDDVEKVRSFALDWFGGDFAREQKLQVQVTGTAHLYHVANELLVRGNLESLVLCLSVVFLLLLVVLRRFIMTLVALVPIFFTLAANFGLLGWCGIPLNVGTAMVSSIAIGIGVDFSIHYITWYRSELRQGHPVETAVRLTILRKGRAILYNMLVIAAGFLVLTASQFVPLMQFGLLVALCMVTTALGSLVIVPAGILFLHRRGHRFVQLK